MSDKGCYNCVHKKCQLKLFVAIAFVLFSIFSFYEIFVEGMMVFFFIWSLLLGMFLFTIGEKWECWEEDKLNTMGNGDKK